ncbi:MAG: hypothetical protein FJW20_06875 [Acidimicrobiia bacterium]|nr:hypothetical protein [Acidimicrobiia bacterium]
MLLLLLVWILVGTAAWVTGAALLRLCPIPSSEPEDRFLAAVCLGLFSLASLTLAASIITHLSGLLPAFAAPLLLALIPSVRRSLCDSSPSRGPLLLLAAILLATALNSSGPVTHHDTGLYHYPLIHWLAGFGAVPGLALVHYRFGFSSSWLAASAAMDASATTILNGLLFALIVFHFLRLLARPNRTAHDSLLLYGYPVILLASLVYRLHVSPSPNLPAALGILLTAWLLRLSPPLALLAAAVAFPVKSSSAAAIPVALFLLVRSQHRILPALIPAALITAPLLLVNLQTSGCPLFPSSLACSENTTAVGRQVAETITWETTAWARYLDRLPSHARFFSLDWLPRWIIQPFNLLFVAAIAAAKLTCWRRKSIPAPVVLGLLGSAYIFIAAPDFRFAFGYTAVLVGYTASIHLRLAPRRLAPLAIALILTDAAAHEAFYRRLPEIPRTNLTGRRLLVPTPLRDGVLSRISEQNGLHLRIPVGDQCWHLAQPCTPYAAAPSLRLCDPGQGFRAGFCR